MECLGGYSWWDADRLGSQLQLPPQPLAAFAGNSDGDTLRIAKQWLLMGVPISNGDPMGKYKHLTTIRRADIPLRTDEELERDVAALE